MVLQSSCWLGSIESHMSINVFPKVLRVSFEGSSFGTNATICSHVAHSKAAVATAHIKNVVKTHHITFCVVLFDIFIMVFFRWNFWISMFSVLANDIFGRKHNFRKTQLLLPIFGFLSIENMTGYRLRSLGRHSGHSLQQGAEKHFSWWILSI